MNEDDQKMVTIKTFSEHTEAELARAALESRGINAMILADDCGGMNTAMTYTLGAARLMVMEDDAEVALKLLDEEAAVENESDDENS